MVVFREFVNQEQMIVDFAMDMYQKQMALLQQSPCIERSLKKCVLICLICCLSCVFFTRRHGFEHLLWPCMCTITDYLLCKRSIICHQSPSISKYGTYYFNFMSICPRIFLRPRFLPLHRVSYTNLLHS